MSLVSMNKPTFRWTLSLGMMALMAALLLINFAEDRVKDAESDAVQAKYRLEAALKGERPKEVVTWDPIMVHPRATGLLVAFAGIATPAAPVALVGAPLAGAWLPAFCIWSVAVVGFFWYGIGFLMDRQLSPDPLLNNQRLPRALHYYFRVLQMISPVMLLVWTLKFLQDHYGYSYWGTRAFHLLPWYEDRNLWFTLVCVAWSAIGTFALIRHARKSRNQHA